MLYNKLTDEELKLVSERVDRVISDNCIVEFAGTTISPYNLKSYLFSCGFEDYIYDENSMDYTIHFVKDDIKLVMMFNAESFHLLLSKDED